MAEPVDDRRLGDLLHAVNHTGDCAVHFTEGPGWEDSCTCGLTHYRGLFDGMSDDYKACIEAIFALAEDERFKRTTDASLARFQKHARVVECTGRERAWLKR